MPKIDAGKLRAVSLSTPIPDLVCLAILMDVPIDLGSTTLEELEWVALYSVNCPQSHGIAMTYPALVPEQIDGIDSSLT